MPDLITGIASETARTAARRATGNALLQAVTYAPPYRWNTAAGRFIDTAGRFVPRETIKTAVERALSDASLAMRDVSQRLRLGEISLREWQTTMMTEMRAVHLVQGSLAHGGFAQMTPALIERVSVRLRHEYGKLDRFARQIADGTQRLDGTMLRRAEQYVRAGRTTFYDERRSVARLFTYDEEINLTTPADHCQECVSLEYLKWVPIGTLPHPGDRECRRNCLCDIGYRNSATGVEWEG